MKIFLCLMFLLSACKTPDMDDVNPIDRYLTPQTKDESELREEYFTQLNSYRQTHGERALIRSEFIEKEAQKHAENMARGEVSFGHTGNFKRCEDIRNDFAFDSSSMCGEIVASGPDTADEILSLWGGSRTSKEKILNPSYIYTGIGIHRSSEGKVYWVQIFLEGL